MRTRPGPGLPIWHRRIGIFAALILLVVASTGIALNHTDRLRLADIVVRASWLLELYGIAVPPAVTYAAGDRLVTGLGGRLYLDGEPIPVSGALVGAAPAGALLAIGLADGLALVDASGALVERLGAAQGLATVRRLGAGATGGLVVETDRGVFSLDPDSLDRRPVAPADARWSAPGTLPPALADRIGRNFAGPGIPLERLLLDLHSGRLLGVLGVGLFDAAGLSLVVLAVTGLWMWSGRR